MSDMNSVCLVGRLVRDVVVKYTQNNVAHSIFSIAVDRSVKHGDEWQNEASYVDIEAWENLAENARKYSAKGKRIGVTGYLLQKRWNKDGVNYSKICVVANTLQIIDRVQSNQQSGPGERPSQQHTQKQMQQYDKCSADNGGFDEDIPF